MINYTSPVDGEVTYGPVLSPQFIRGVAKLQKLIREVA